MDTDDELPLYCVVISIYSVDVLYPLRLRYLIEASFS